MEATVTKAIELNYDRKAGRFVLDIDGQPVRQNVCEFLHTLSFVVGKDIEQHLLSTDSRYDNVRVPLTSTGTTTTLNLQEFVSLREAYGNQMYLLKLEDLLLRKDIAI